MNFINELEKGQKGMNKGIPLGHAFNELNKKINGIQKGKIYGVIAGQKVGKSTFVDNAFLLNPYIYSRENNKKLNWIYLSFEIDRITKEFEFATFFLHFDYKINKIKLQNNIKKDNKDFINLSSAYLQGKVLDDDNNLIKINDEIYKKLIKVYENRIIPLFGKYDNKGIKIENGKINFIEHRNNPTGIFKNLIKYAEKFGKFKYDEINGRIIKYEPEDSDNLVIVIIDHLRKLKLEQGWSLKQTIDNFINYCIEIKKNCNYSFVMICHTNREVNEISRLKFMGSNLYPTSENIKDSGNLAEDADIIISMFNPNDDKYKLNEYFDLKLKKENGDKLYPFLRTLHLVENRDGNAPLHFKVNMNGTLKTFKKF